MIANQKVGRDVSSMLPPSQFDDSPRVPTCSDESSTRLETAMVESCDFDLETARRSSLAEPGTETTPSMKLSAVGTVRAMISRLI